MADYSKLASIQELEKALKDISSMGRKKENAIGNDWTRVQSLSRPASLFAMGLHSATIDDRPLDSILLGLVRALKARIRRL